MTGTLIEPILEKIVNGEALSPDEAAALFDARDILAIGMTADELRRRRHGARFTFVRVAHVDAAAAASGNAAWDGAPGEVRLDGAPGDLAQAESAVAKAVEAAAGGVPVTGFSLADLEAVSGGDADALAPALRRLRSAGLAAIAEAPIDRLQRPDHAIAACLDAGLPIARLTVERARPSDRASLLTLAARLVSAHPALRAFAPLPRRAAGATPSTGFEDVHLVALARLLVPVDHIQVDWTLYGPKLAQVALTFGADDVDDVSASEGAAEGRRRAPLEEIRRNIRAASGEPVERDALFAPRERPAPAA